MPCVMGGAEMGVAKHPSLPPPHHPAAPSRQSRSATATIYIRNSCNTLHCDGHHKGILDWGAIDAITPIGHCLASADPPHAAILR